MASDSRQLSKLTGVYVESIEVMTPPFEEPDVVQEFVGRGVTSEFFLEPVEMVGRGRVQEFFTGAKDMLDPRGDRFRMRYSLLVRARTRRSAEAKARSYARFVNPFTPEVMTVAEARVAHDKSDLIEGLGPLTEFYNVSVELSK